MPNYYLNPYVYGSVTEAFELLTQPSSFGLREFSTSTVVYVWSDRMGAWYMCFPPFREEAHTLLMPGYNKDAGLIYLHAELQAIQLMRVPEEDKKAEAKPAAYLKRGRAESNEVQGDKRQKVSGKAEKEEEEEQQAAEQPVAPVAPLPPRPPRPAQLAGPPCLKNFPFVDKDSIIEHIIGQDMQVTRPCQILLPCEGLSAEEKKLLQLIGLTLPKERKSTEYERKSDLVPNTLRPAFRAEVTVGGLTHYRDRGCHGWSSKKRFRIFYKGKCIVETDVTVGGSSAAFNWWPKPEEVAAVLQELR